MSQLIVIQFANPRKNAQAPSHVDTDAMQADLHAQLETILQERLGEDIRLRIKRGETNEIRIEGRFALPTNEVKALVSEVLGEVMENFDPSGY